MKYEFLNLNKHNLNELNNLYNTIFKRNRSQKIAEWEFLSNPIRHKLNYVIKDNDNIIGHWGIIPHHLIINSKEFKGGKIENSMIRDSFRGKGIYKDFEIFTSNQAIKSGLIIWSVSTPSAIGLRTKIGYQLVGYFKSYEIVLLSFNIKAFLYLFKYLFDELISPKLAIKNFYKRLLLCRDFIDTTKFCKTNIESVLNILDLIKKYNYNTIKRSREYFNWRFGLNPIMNYKYIIHKETNSYAIYTIKGDSAIIHDFGRVKNGIFDMLNDSELQSLFIYFRKSGFLRIKIKSIQNSILSKYLKEQGFFISRKHSMLNQGALVIKGLENNLDLDNWFFTNIYSEGIN